MDTPVPGQWDQISPLLDEVLELAPEQRTAWLRSLREQDAKLASTLQALLDEQQQLEREGFLESPALLTASGLAGQSLGAYTLVSQIGQGGMGTVWLARRSDGRFERQAAVKFVNLALAGQGHELRFRREGSILGRLTHPHIAELLDAGISSNGQPYLILEYVDGVAIDQYCDEQKLDLEARVRLFLDVLGAVAHAHANLIVHRDLKPSNVLVTATGEVKLLDFGIAKLLEGEGQVGAATLLTHESGSALTPLYAAPEQLKNQPVTTATDVFALGVLLYQMLTGSHPAGAGPFAPVDLLRAVLEVDPPRPSEVVITNQSASVAERRASTLEKLQRQLRGDLDTIVGKALKKNPQERYPSVSAFAEDLQRYLKQEPIGARPDTIAYRAGKFLHRNKKVVALSATALLLVIGSLAAGLLAANRERKVAEHRFAQVRELADEFIDLDGKIRGFPGSTRVRMQIVSDSLRYLTALGSEAHVDNDLALDLAYAYIRVAHAQGDPTSPNLGQFAEAELSLTKAEKFVDAVLSRDPENRQALLRATTIAHDRMILADTLGRPEQSLEQARKAANLIDRFMAGGKATPSQTYSMAYFYSNVAGEFVNCRRLNEAVHGAARGLEISQPVPNARRVQANIYYSLAQALWQMGDLNGALKTANQAIEMQTIQAATGHVALRINLAMSLCLRGQILGRADAEPNLGRRREAVADIERAVEIAEDLAGKDPQDYLGRHNVAVFGLELGNIVRHTDSQKSLAIYDHALTRIREAKANGGTQRDEAQLLAASSYPLRWLGRKKEARQRVERALELLHDAGRYPADKVEPMTDVYDTLRAQAEDLAGTGQTAAAALAYQQLLDKMIAWRADPQNDLRDAACLSRTWTALADLLRRSGRNDDARPFEAQRAELWKQWQGKLPNAHSLLGQTVSQITPPSNHYLPPAR